MLNAEAIQAIEGYVRKCGRDYTQWCVGTAADPVERLLRHHGVAEEGDGCGWITFRCGSADQALGVREHLVARGMKGAASDMDATAASVYAFKITGATRC